MRLFIIFSLVMVFLTAMADQYDSYRSNQGLTVSGDLIVLRIVPADKTAKIYIVGTKAAELNLNKDAKVLSVDLARPNQETLRINNQ